EAAWVAVLSGKHLVPGRKIETGDLVIALDWPAEVFPTQSDIRRQTPREPPVVLDVRRKLRVRQVRRKRRGLDCVARGKAQKQIGQRIEAGRDGKRHRSAELAGKPVGAVRLPPLNGAQALELQRETGFDAVRTANRGQVVDDLRCVAHPL